ncbi:hypothetical protein [Streptomyces sp. NPDC001985]|uniref:hypothetical protein n=1 Tax=Streptomyces sp. NPDC001985 TaxID=3154406 RepID=UPI003331DA4E
MPSHPPVIVHPPSPGGGRRVTVRGRIAGLAHGRGDLAGLLRTELGLRAEVIDLQDPSVIEWRGGGAETWPRP